MEAEDRISEVEDRLVEINETERREIEVTRRRRGGIKRGESKLASDHFAMCSPQSGPLRDVHRVTQRREEGERRQRWPGG